MDGQTLSNVLSPCYVVDNNTLLPPTLSVDPSYRYMYCSCIGLYIAMWEDLPSPPYVFTPLYLGAPKCMARDNIVGHKSDHYFGPIS